MLERGLCLLKTVLTFFCGARCSFDDCINHSRPAAQAFNSEWNIHVKVFSPTHPNPGTKPLCLETILEVCSGLGAPRGFHFFLDLLGALVRFAFSMVEHKRPAAALEPSSNEGNEQEPRPRPSLTERRARRLEQVRNTGAQLLRQFMVAFKWDDRQSASLKHTSIRGPETRSVQESSPAAQ